ncbi:type II toxin-antitoxin system antitoxin SocA domain-containing protein [Micromonospora sp. NPDC049799]|uniref:Panacea domain-containing protein n=1 Tax=Micromonospora sp. NPDC049799 TaxID=3154741 RepID=UPI0033D6CA24
MARVEDVAAYILSERGPMTAMKLQKLCYYSQAWHLVWEEELLFDSRIEAWANGPVINDLYRLHRGRFRLAEGDIPGDSARLSEDESSTVDAVLEFYGDMSAHHLSDLTHRETPWRAAREAADLAPMERGNEVIEPAAMHEYYLGIYSEGE